MTATGSPQPQQNTGLQTGVTTGAGCWTMLLLNLLLPADTLTASRAIAWRVPPNQLCGRGLMVNPAVGAPFDPLLAPLPALLCPAPLAPVTGRVVRSRLRDRLLQGRLPGYGAYARQVGYCLVPGIW